MRMYWSVLCVSNAFYWSNNFLQFSGHFKMFCSGIGETCKFSYLLANDNIIFLVLNIYLNFKMGKTNPFYAPVIYNL